MAKITESYIAADGTHWADASVGDDLYYYISFTAWLANENDSLAPSVPVAWTLPSGVTSSDDYLTGSVAYIKLATPTAGTYEVTCTLSSIEGAKTQTKTQVMKLKVV